MVARAFCVALSAAITVLIASALGLPVSSTHIALGAIFGVGFLREVVTNRRRRARIAVPGDRSAALTAAANAGIVLTNAELKTIKKDQRRKLVRRHYVFAIAAAWVVTVPAAALLAAMFFFTLRGMLLD